MTHDELLDKISYFTDIIKSSDGSVGIAVLTEPAKALRAVVELHKPSKDKCWECSFPLDSIYVPYPCPTIQAIEKELQ